jgi:hypothetical protein
MRRNAGRLALFSVRETVSRARLLHLSAVLRNAVGLWGPLLTPGNFWHKITWPEFQPSLPLGLPAGCHTREDTVRRVGAIGSGRTGS